MTQKNKIRKKSGRINKKIENIGKKEVAERLAEMRACWRNLDTGTLMPGRAEGFAYLHVLQHGAHRGPQSPLVGMPEVAADSGAVPPCGDGSARAMAVVFQRLRHSAS